MYFNADQVSASFKRLASKRLKGKTHLERTSCLMYFLAFDAACKKIKRNCLDLNPDKAEGKYNRKVIQLEFAKLVTLEQNPQKLLQVSELGKIDYTGKDPEKRISSNFLTVPLKKASEQLESCFYPKRPPAPLIKLGKSATGLKWGIDYHEDWQSNLPKFLSEIKYPTPFTDLAIFVMRDTKLENHERDCAHTHILAAALAKRFSLDLANFWFERIEKEELMRKSHILEQSFSLTHQAFAKSLQNLPTNRLDALSKKALVNHIIYLEGILKTNKIEFDHPNKEKSS